MTIRTLLTLSGIALLLLPLGLLAQETGSVTGTVQIDGAATAGARVVCSSSADSSWEVETASGDDGGYEIEDVPLGVVTVVAYGTDGEYLGRAEGELVAGGEVLVLDPQPES